MEGERVAEQRVRSEVRRAKARARLGRDGEPTDA